MSSKPRCFFLNGLQEKKIEFKHRAFIYDRNTTLPFHEVGFFYTTIPENFTGTARQCKLYIKSNGLLWNLRRMKIVLEFTDEDFEEASRLASIAEPNLTTVNVGDKTTEVIL
uniref:Uncharacterized protein n=1 Tax=Romanomermis culicivorax TaxID=13658 RepID=A0A915L4S0_ROMCU